MLGDNEDQVPVGEIKRKGGIDFTQGSLIATGRPLDAALSGNGFFALETPDGPLYTRNGVFHVNRLGRLVDLSGRMVSGADGPINIPAGVSESSINIAEDGTVKSGEARLGRLKIVDFGVDQDKLIGAGENCFIAPASVRPTAAESVTVRQGYQENSNVKLTTELVDLISVSRLYETNMNLLKKRHENAKVVLGIANG
jgi:flagellar basal body rod protein FlgG